MAVSPSILELRAEDAWFTGHLPNLEAIKMDLKKYHRELLHRLSSHAQGS
jgi:hypothetical protein